MSDHNNQPAGHATNGLHGREGATYLAECYWPGVTAARLAAAAARAADDVEATCTELILIPDDEIVLALFQASSAAAVTHASRRAGLPAERIVESLHVTAARVEPTPTLESDHAPAPHQPATPGPPPPPLTVAPGAPPPIPEATGAPRHTSKGGP